MIKRIGGCLCLLLLGATLAHADIASNLVAHWPMDDGSGTTVSCSGCATLNGTFGGSPADPTWTVAASCITARPALNGCLTFASASGEYVSLPNEAALSITGPVTLALWVKTSTPNATLIGGYDAASTFAGYGLRLELNGAIGYWRGSGSWVAATTSVTDGAWHHVAVTISGTTVTFYRDGVVDGTPGGSGQPSAWSGIRRLGSNTNNATYYTGAMDAVYIYSRALTASDIAELYTTGLSPARRSLVVLD